MRSILVAVSLGVLSTLFAPRLMACGGTFCDGGGPPMPVDQTGENVLFVMSEGQVEAHVQIQYTGDPERFAWVVPMPAEPTVTVGSQLLFLNLMNGSVPSYSVRSTFAFCDDDSGSSSSGCGFMSSSDEAAGARFAGGSGDNGNVQSNPDLVTLKQSVGSFEVTVLKPTTATELVTWLDQNGYLPDDEAPPIIDEYIAAGHVFVALKLTAGAGIDEIHPLVFRYPGSEPCVPLKLTRIAAVEDMSVRVFFLGQKRVVPVSYKQVSFNPLQLDWLLLGQNYTELVGRAIDSPVADGRAFVAEYSGPSSVVSQQGINDVRWSSAPFTSADPTDVVSILDSQGLIDCTTSLCTANHPLVFPLLHRYLPVPTGLSDESFYGCLSCNEGLIDMNAWDAAAFASDLEELVVAPGRAALATLKSSPYLTRLLTRISPSEMLADPTFAETHLSATELPDVGQTRLANLNTDCAGNTTLALPDQRTVTLEQITQQPSFAGMPAAEIIEEFTAAGDQMVLVDNRAEIESQLKAWNDQHPPRSPNAGQTFNTGSSDSESGGCALGRRSLPRPAHAVITAFVAAALLRRSLRADRRVRRNRV